MTPGVYALPPGAPFAAAFVAGLRARLGPLAPLEWARVRVLVNTGRALRGIGAALAEAAPGLLPRLGLLSALADDPLADPDLPAALDPMRRHLTLTRLVGAYLAAAAGRAPVTAAPDLAQALAGLIDELHGAGVAPERLEALVPDHLAAHWQETLRLIAVVRGAWPAILAEAGALDPAARQALVIERLVARWGVAPPGGVVIAAGSTGSVPGTARLLAAIAGLPQGAVVLPGFDPGIEPEIWAAMGPDHPMAPFGPLLARLGMEPRDVEVWHGPPPGGARLALLTHALRPAPVTDAWHRAAPALAAEAGAATAGLTLVEAESPRHEAAAIALAIRRAVAEPGCRVALVTGDASLARRVTAELQRFDIVPDDSVGRPLWQSPAAVFLRLVAEAPGADAVGLAALLAHPLTAPGVARGRHLWAARAYEAKVLRAGPTRGLAPWPGAVDDAAAWWAAMAAGLAPMAEGGSLAAVVAAHRRAAEALSTAPGAAPGVWSGADGAALDRALAQVARAADAAGPGPVADYPGLLRSLLGTRTLRPEPGRPHPRVAIRGPREARIEAVDVMILGGLTEGAWPARPGADPWLSRPMRAALGLAPPEAAIGLAAHDFLGAALAPRAILTRAAKVDGSPQVAARWLVRLENLLGGTDPAALAAMRARGRALLDLVPLVHRPAQPVPRAPRPAPTPPLAARPRRLSVTTVELLIRDAYAVYARHVLRLQVLDPLGRAPEFRDRGEVMHTILERFVAATADGVPEGAAARALLLAQADAVLAARVPWPDLARIWRGRVARFADWLIAGERLRRDQGRPVLLEGKGEMRWEAPGGPFTLRARADRIDALGPGEAAIYDYKTGAPPSGPQVGLFHHQLHLQALILAEGGFEGLGPLRAVRGAYLGLTGGEEGGKETMVADLGDQMAAAREGLARLIADYDDPATPYLARGRPYREGDGGDYDHLARRAEWQGAEE